MSDDAISILQRLSEDMKKALTSRTASVLSRSAAREELNPLFTTPVAEDVGSIKTIGISRYRAGSHEPVTLPADLLENPPVYSENVQKSESLQECGGCGYLIKSVGSCPKCACNGGGEALPIWRR